MVFNKNLSFRVKIRIKYVARGCAYKYGVYNTVKRVIEKLNIQLILKMGDRMLQLIVSKLKKVTFSDIIGVFFFLVLFIPAFLKKMSLKRKKQQRWLICEHATGRDNGYVFYKYMREHHPEIESVYAMNLEGIDYEKMKPLGNLIQWGSLKHYFYYMTATWNVTSHKNGNPNQSLFTVLQKAGFYNNVIFLQHGVLYQDFKMFHKKNCSFRMFVCGAKGEYDFVKAYYGYDDEVKYTGLARFDHLHNVEPDRDTILYIPTWRRWLGNEEKFKESEYYERIMSLLNSKKLEQILEKYGKKLLFYPHAGSWPYAYLYATENTRVEVLDPQKTDIQALLKRGVMLITDYSSIFTDFSYMEKSILHYQYDYMDYIQRHCQGDNKEFKNNSYFDFERDGFGPVVHTVEEVLFELEKAIERDFAVDKKYLERIRKFFVLHDSKNCERIYSEIERLG